MDKKMSNKRNSKLMPESRLTPATRLAIFLAIEKPYRKKIDKSIYDKIEKSIEEDIDRWGTIRAIVWRKGGERTRAGYGSTAAEATDDAIYNLMEIGEI
jgi:hypothetical protein